MQGIRARACAGLVQGSVPFDFENAYNQYQAARVARAAKAGGIARVRQVARAARAAGLATASKVSFPLVFICFLVFPSRLHVVQGLVPCCV